MQIQEGYKVIHYERRDRRFDVVKITRNRARNRASGETLYRLKGDDGTEFEVSGESLEVVPLVNDQVCLLPGLYLQWLKRRIEREENDFKRHEILRTEWDPLCYSLADWMSEILTVQRLYTSEQGEQMALVRSAIERHNIPVKCLKVYARQQQMKEAV